MSRQAKDRPNLAHVRLTPPRDGQTDGWVVAVGAHEPGFLDRFFSPLRVVRQPSGMCRLQSMFLGGWVKGGSHR